MIYYEYLRAWQHRIGYKIHGFAGFSMNLSCYDFQATEGPQKRASTLEKSNSKAERSSYCQARSQRKGIQ
jgi:hypothetical protein